DARHRPVVGPRRPAEDVHGRDPALVLAHVRERPARHVADRPDALGGAAALVDRDAPGPRLDADGLEADALRARAPAGRHHDLRAAGLAAVVQGDDLLRAVLPDAYRAPAQEELDAVLAQHVAEELPDPRVLALGEPRRPL